MGKRTASHTLESLLDVLTVRQQVLQAPDQRTHSRPTSATACSTAPTEPLSKEEILAKRRQHLGPNVALFFKEDPLHIVRARGCELFDAEGNAYLDCEPCVA